MARKEIWKGNDLIQASYALTLNEMRLIQLVLANLFQKGGVFKDEWYEVDLEEFSEVYGLDRHGTYIEITKVVKGLMSRVIKIPTKFLGQVAGEKSITVIHWVRKVEYDPELSRVRLMWDEDIIQFLSELESCFTKYKLEHIAKFRSSYHIRMYEVFKQWEKVGRRYYEIKTLREILHLQDKHEGFGKMNEKILDPAIRAINRYTDLTVSLEFKKEGRRVVGVWLVGKLTSDITGIS